MVYVDELVKHPNAKGIFKAGSCHLFTDGEKEELIDFGLRIGLKKEWIKSKKSFYHFDIVASKRKEAIKNGAKEVYHYC